MKLTLKEIESQIALARSLPAEAQAALIATLKTASVVEVDEKGVETPVTVKIVDPPEVKAATEQKAGLSADEIKQIVTDAVSAQAKAVGAAPVHQPEVKVGGMPSGLKFYGQVRNFKRAKVGNFEPNERAYRFGMWSLACMGSQWAKQWCNENGIEIKSVGLDPVLKLHQGNVNSTGGFLINDEFSADMIDLRVQYGTFRRNARVMPMTTDTLHVPRRDSGLTAYFVAEGAAGTESTKGWSRVTLIAKDLMVITRMTAQLSSDAVINIGDDLAGEIGYAFANTEDSCGWNGDATSTYGGIEGVRTKLSTINGVDDGGGLVLASGNAYSEIVLGDLHKVVGRTPTYARMGAKWYCSPLFNDTVLQKLLTAAGGNTVTDIANGGGPRFLGYPVELVEVLPTAEANSQICALFGDLRKAAMFGDRQQDSIAFSTEASVGGQSVFERNEVAIRGTERFDIAVHDVGTSSAAGPIVGLITASS